jgi:RNA polymerase sigma-70 factor, ECF subfamily
MKSKEQILEDIFNQYYQVIYQFIILMTSSKEKAEALTQVVFEKANNELENYKEGYYRAWIFSIARSITYKYCRKSRIMNFFISIVHPGLKESVPEEINNMNVQTQFLYQNFLKIKIQYREIIILHKIIGYKIYEVASILGWKELKVKNTLNQALHNLKNKMNV